MSEALEFSPALVQAARRAESIVVLTGAGISAESGVPTFRGADGLWKKFRPEELASMDAFLKNPELVWEWYEYRRKLIREVRPNPGHVALVEIERAARDFLLVTQNVDNLHRLAGSRNVVELHGNIMRNLCSRCGAEEPGASEADHEERGNAPPACSRCGGLIRPGVVWFGEQLPPGSFERAERAAMTCDFLLCVGTSGAVFPAASLPFIAREAGAYVVEVNSEPTEISREMSETLIGKAGEILPALARFLTPGDRVN